LEHKKKTKKENWRHFFYNQRIQGTRLATNKKQWMEK